MKRTFIVCAWLAAAAAASCQGTGGGPARSPIGAFGTEATVGGTESNGGNEAAGGGTLLDLCGRACANIASCEPGDPDCAAECASDVPPGCEAEFRAFVQCIATAQICINGTLDPSACTATLFAIDTCASGAGTGAGGTSGGSAGGGTGMAGATGTTGTTGAPPR